MNEVEQLMEKLREYMPLLRKKYNVKTLGIFGSYIRDEQTKKSDLDILVDFEKPIGLLDLVGLEMELSELLGKKVDLVLKSVLKPRIGKHILEEVRCL